MNVAISEFTMADHEEAAALWRTMPEIGLHDADTPERMESFFARNPGLSFVAREDGEAHRRRALRARRKTWLPAPSRR